MMHCMTARKIKQFKLQSCQISEARQDNSDNSELPWNTGKDSREFSAIPTKQMPSRLGSKGWDTSLGFWPQWSLTITNNTFSKTILLFLQSTPAILSAISTQNSPGSQSSHIKESKWIILERPWMKLLKYFYYSNDKQVLYGQKTGQLQIDYSTNLPVKCPSFSIPDSSTAHCSAQLQLSGWKTVTHRQNFWTTRPQKSP